MQIGFHTSISWGLEQPFLEAQKIGANTLQVFSKSPRNWTIPQYSSEAFEMGTSARRLNNIQGGIVHSIYLVNLWKPPQEAVKDRNAVLFDLYFWDKLGFDFVNTHLGKSAWKRSEKEVMENMKRNLELVLTEANKHSTSVQFLRENTAWQGSEIGWDFEQLKKFHKEYMRELPIWYCVDTAHLRWAGRDIWKWEEILSMLDEAIGVNNIKAIHLNDSKVPLWSRLDRHANLWYGFIWWERLLKVWHRAAKNNIPVIVETPDWTLRPRELEFLIKAADGDFSRLETQKGNYKTQVLKKFEK